MDIMSDLTKLTLGSKLVILETQEELEKGLLVYDAPVHDKVFLFKFPTEDIREFHTFNMCADIDIYFLDENKEIVHKELNCKPNNFFSSVFPAKYVIEKFC
jgi:uncharacterized membrane protein (UPF0127 family)